MKPVDEDDDDILDEYGLRGLESTSVPEIKDAEVTRGPSQFSGNTLGSRIMWSTVKSATQITVQVNFLSIGTFWGTLFGKPIT